MIKNNHLEYYWKSALASDEDTRTLAAAAWDLLNATFNVDQELSCQEKTIFKTTIKNFIAGKCDYYLGYLEFCERILLLHKNPSKYSGRSSYESNSWFAEDMFFQNTKSDYARLLRKRKANPELRKKWKALAEAILEMQETPSAYIFQYWENWFRQVNAKKELLLFYQAVKKSSKSPNC